MKKRIKLILCVITVVAMLATATIGCSGCTPPTPTPTKVDYAVTPIADLTDYSSTAGKAAVVYNTADTKYTDARNSLAAKIETEKSYYESYEKYAKRVAEANGEEVDLSEFKYLRYTADNIKDRTEGTETDMVGRYENNKIVEQSSLLKILANAKADQLIYVLGYSGLEQAKMISLITYIAEDGEKAKENPTVATGLLEDYDAIREWNDEIEEKGTSTEQGQTAYKKRARKSRAMNKRLFDTGMDGGDAGRAALEVFEYVQIVAEEMRADYNDKHAGAVLDNMTEYFKKELLDYDTLVLIRSNNELRWRLANSTDKWKVATNKPVVFDENTHSYEGSYTKPNTEDKDLVKAYGYSFEYERGNYNALSDADFEKELTYRFANRMSDEEAKDYSRIQRTQYEKAFRYSEKFYTGYYEALQPINRAQEKHEGAVFGFTNRDRQETGHPFKDVSSTIKVQGVGGDVTEEIISVDLGGESAGSYAEMSYSALQIGLSDQLKAGDMQHYYWGIETNITAQNGANNDRMSNDTGSQVKGNFNLKLVNLKMTDFILSTFVGENNAAGLTKIMKAQTRLYVADYSRMVKSFRRQVVRELAKLEKEGILEATRDGNDIKYVLKEGASYDDDQQKSVEKNIGRASVMINNLENTRKLVNISNRDTTLNQVVWTQISSQIKDAADFNYSQEFGANVAWGAKSKKLEDLLIKKDANGDYDKNWATSVFVSNNANVLAYSSGQIKVDFQIATTLSENGKVSGRKTYGDVYGYSGDTLKAIIAAQNYDDNNIAQGLSFPEVSNSSGAKYKAVMTKFYLKHDYTAANPTNGAQEISKYYYEVSEDEAMEYDIVLFVGYEPVA